MPKVAGVDLSASPRRKTGVAVLAAQRGRHELVELTTVHGGVDDIASLIISHAPSLVVIDAPLAPPPRGHGFRLAELAAMRLGARLLPLTLPSMQALLRRGVRLRQLLGVVAEVAETHPRSALRVSGCGAAELLKLLGIEAPPGAGKDEVDALLAAAVGAGLIEGYTVSLGPDTFLLLPQPGLCRQRKKA